MTKEKVTSVFFSQKFRYKDKTWSVPLINWTIFISQGGVYRHFSTFKAFKECLYHFHSTQFSPYTTQRLQVFLCSVVIFWWKKKTEIVPLDTAKIPLCLISVYHCKWPHNDVTVMCAYHFDNGVVLSILNLISTNGLSAFQLLLHDFPMISHW